MQIVLIYAIFVLAFVKSSLSCDGVKVSLNQNDIEDGHNRYRADVANGKIHNYTAKNMRVMKWDEDLAERAQEWADTCPDGHSGVFGENIFWQLGNVPLDSMGESAVESWASERELQDADSLSPFVWDINTGHWTQMIWADTDKVGCGAARWPGGDYGYTTVVVCQYAEAGNIIGGRGRAFDIGTPCTACKEDCDPDYFSGVLCKTASTQPSIKRGPTEPATVKTTEPPAKEDVSINDITSDLSCESVQVNLSQNGIVDIHNGYRADVANGKTHNYTAKNMRVMRWDEDLANQAQEWADTCPDNHSGVYGENIYWQLGSGPVDGVGGAAVESWASERELQDIESLSPFVWDASTGHWTQMIWSDTDKVGCGAARWAGGAYGYTTAVVCQYAAAGNIIGGTGQAIAIGTPCTACKADCDPDYFGGVLCN